ncbi:RloB family protein [Myxococcota bacterium]|nr:RloB family protein [Myxococcota bacterium]
MSGRIKRPLDRAVNVRDASLFVIATEGAKTEPAYFEAFKSPRVRIEVLPTSEDNRSAPKHVVERLRAFKKKFQLGAGDELWAVIDFDRWGEVQISEIAAEAAAGAFALAVSRPCFEFWLWLHVDDWTLAERATADSLESALRTRLGTWQKARPDVARFMDGVEDAIRRAAALDAPGTDRWPQTAGSHVYKLARALRRRAPGGLIAPQTAT